ncbi:hypothetical protein [Terrimonas pollutisoli]|uniref:hypothetical protein n=1 Tax=Terrimonas pollutisoli TaxID=3034147 RepID=UPI0023EAA552|nr:hypothetical protein [Terrimonas sp. H1YJ31]
MRLNNVNEELTALWHWVGHIFKNPSENNQESFHSFIFLFINNFAGNWLSNHQVRPVIGRLSKLETSTINSGTKLKQDAGLLKSNYARFIDVH